LSHLHLQRNSELFVNMWAWHGRQLMADAN